MVFSSHRRELIEPVWQFQVDRVVRRSVVVIRCLSSDCIRWVYDSVEKLGIV